MINKILFRHYKTLIKTVFTIYFKRIRTLGYKTLLTYLRRYLINLSEFM